jgi:hypothetical protein
MVRSTKPRGEPRRRSGSGRAKTPEAEQARREKIRKAALLRKKQVRVVIHAYYRKPGRTGKDGRNLPNRYGWNYDDRDHFTRIPAGIANDEAALARHLGKLAVGRHRVYFPRGARVVEYLD